METWHAEGLSIDLSHRAGGGRRRDRRFGYARRGGAELQRDAQDQYRRFGRAAQRGAHLASRGQGTRLLRQALHRAQYHPVRRRRIGDRERGDGVALHPEDVYLAKKQKPGLNVLVQLADLMPNYMFNAYGASLEWIARDRALLRDTAAAMIEANRAMFRDKASVVPIIEKATDKPRDAVEYAIDVLTKNCIWSINTGFDPARTQWSIDNSAENGDLEKDRKPTVEQVANIQLAKEAVEAAGGPVTIGNCKD